MEQGQPRRSPIPRRLFSRTAAPPPAARPFIHERAGVRQPGGNLTKEKFSVSLFFLTTRQLLLRMHQISLYFQEQSMGLRRTNPPPRGSAPGPRPVGWHGCPWAMLPKSTPKSRNWSKMSVLECIPFGPRVLFHLRDPPHFHSGRYRGPTMAASHL